jgi:hypothetical protein
MLQPDLTARMQGIRRLPAVVHLSLGGFMRISAVILGALAGGLIAGCGKQPGPDTDSAADAVRDAAEVVRDAADGGRDRPGRERAAADASASDAASAASPDGRDTVFAPLLNDLDRARGVQQTVDEQAEKLRKDIEKAEGAAP